MNWFYESGGHAVGPIPAAEFESLAAVGTIAPDTLVWREGMTEWQPRSSVGTVAAVGFPVSVALATPGLCQDCGGTFPAGDLVTIAGATVCARCKPARLQMLHEGEVTMPGRLWRSGKTLVAARDAQLPERCVHCNTTANLRRLKRRLYWHHPAVYLTILVNLLVYLVVALIVRKTVQVELSVCHAHVVRRRWKIVLSWLLLLAVPVSVGLLIAYKVENALWILPLLFLVSAVVVSLLSRLVYARKIDEKDVWVGGVCPEFLVDLPTWPGN